MEINIKYEPSRKEIRNLIFLKDVLWLTFSAFGGPQAHVAMMFKFFVDKRKYITEEELIELNALCQILPGPTSTQTITAVGYKIGGVFLAVLTLLIWIIPAVIFMTIASLGVLYSGKNNISMDFAKYIQPMAIGFIAYAAFTISMKVINNVTGLLLLISAALISFFIRTPWVFPLVLLIGGAITARQYKKHNKERQKRFKVQWFYLVAFFAILIGSAILTGFTRNVFVSLFENFYRNGSLIFGGGQVLIPLIYTEFVEFNHYLTSQEFLTGFGLVQALPGPVFAFCSYIGGLASKDYGTGGVILGSAVSTIAIFTPGTLLIFFVVQIWDELKKFRIVRASLEGINAAASGMVCGAAFLLFETLFKKDSIMNLNIIAIDIFIIILTFVLLKYTKIPSPVLVGIGLLAGFLF